MASHKVLQLLEQREIDIPFPGDNLSKISQKFYGDANKYMTIAKANHIDGPNKIKAGQELIIPAA